MTTAAPDHFDAARYAQARQAANRAQALRIVQIAMREGVFGADVSLVVTPQDGAPVTLRHADEALDFIYRHDVARLAGVVLQTPSGSLPLDDVSALWHGPLKQAVKAKLGEGFDENHWLAFQYELLDSLNNETLSLYAEHEAMEGIRHRSRQYDNFFLWLTRAPEAKTLMRRHHHDVDSLLLQLASFSGHRTHPSSKMKLLRPAGGQDTSLSLTPGQVRQYAPEFAPDVALPLLAVRADHVTCLVSKAIGSDYRAMFARQFPGPFKQWQAELEAAVGPQEAARYVPLPVHPLQLPEIRHRFAGALAQKDVLLLPHAHVTERPTISLRTLTPVDDPQATQIKLPINMRMTSEVRTLDPIAVANSPIESDLVTSLLSRDKTIAGRLRILPELLGIYWGGADIRPKTTAYYDARQLSCVLKANPAGLTHPDEIRMPLNALFQPSPQSGHPILVDVMHAAGARDAEAAKAWFSRYAQVVIGADLGTMARYGICLESHQQNLDIIFDRATAQPKSELYRDINGGIQLYKPLAALTAPEQISHLRGDDEFAELPACIGQITHTTLMSNLFPAITVISEAYGLPKSELYAILRAQVQTTIADARREHLPTLLASLQPPDRQAAQQIYEQTLSQLESGMLAPHIATKCLLGMRLSQTHRISYVESPNPLARC